MVVLNGIRQKINQCEVMPQFLEPERSLVWEKHIDSFCKTVGAGMGIMKIKPCVPSKKSQNARYLIWPSNAIF